MTFPRYTREHFSDVARVLREARQRLAPSEVREQLLLAYLESAFGMMFKTHNPNFNWRRFLDDCAGRGAGIPD